MKSIYSSLLIGSFLALCATGGLAQKPADIDFRRWVTVGTEVGAKLAWFKDPDTDSVQRYGGFRLGPLISFSVLKHTNVGFSYEYEFVRSNIVERPSLHGYGFFVNHRFMPPWRKLRGFGRIAVFYTELAWHQTNYYEVDNGDILTTRQWNNQFLWWTLGVNMRLYKRLYIDMGYRPMWQLTPRRLLELTPRLGIEYHFGEMINR